MGNVTFAREMGGDAVDTFDWAATIQICVEVSGGAFACVVFTTVAATANWAYDNILREIALFSRVAKLMASVALSNKRKRVKKSGFASGTKHENGVFSDARKARAILIKERMNDRGFLLLGLERGAEPSGCRDNTEAFKGIIDF